MKIKELVSALERFAPLPLQDGFDYSKGYEYTLLVKKTTLLNPPADASNIAYELVEVLSKVGVEYEYTIEVDGPFCMQKKKICSRRVY